ncbi:hypothetical protein [Sedimenticola sp.]|uniref:hypothetical protein n=1 Tax=Sedimenticola sp. TaxID=1940285 RepID=UPI003D09BE0A
MEIDYPAVDQLNLLAAQVRLLADLTLEKDNLQGVDPDALALVLQDIAARLERIAKSRENSASHHKVSDLPVTR